MKSILLACVLLASITSFAKADKKEVIEKKPAHREEKAHKHGAAQLEIAFQGANGQIDLEAATEGIYGFEYLPKTDEDKKKQHNAFALIETNIAEMIQFEASLKCEISKTNIEIKNHDGEKHSDINASFKVICQKSPTGTTITFHFQKTFPKLKEVNVQLVADDLQKSFKANKDGSKLVLKK
jgi:hypothetical protein